MKKQNLNKKQNVGKKQPVDKKQVVEKTQTIDKKQLRRTRLCSISLVISGVFTVFFMIFSVAPFLSAATGIFVYLILGIGAGLISFASLGMVWIDEGFKKKWADAFKFADSLMNNGQQIATAVGKNVIWISIVALLLCSFGFLINIISYSKYKDSKYKLAISIACISMAFICLIVSNIIYLTYKDNPIG